MFNKDLLFFTLLLISSLVPNLVRSDSPDQADLDKPTPEYAPDAPDFKPTTITAHFIEQFSESSEKDGFGRWQKSNATKASDDTEEEFRYDGEWAIETPYKFPGIKNDAGLVVKSAAKHHAISVQLPEPFINEGKTLVLQYEVKLQQGLECGGAYLKLLTQSSEGVKFKEFDDKTPYTIMFGPDRCAFTDKVHFIYRQFDKKSEKIREHHLDSPPVPINDKLSNLYTLVVRPDNEYEIWINLEKQTNGTLIENFYPRLNPLKMIDDLNETMPEDWVTDPRIPDPEAKKPEDWDEDAPYEIPDPDVKKPEDWLDDEELEVPDPDAERPDGWDDEEDGEWIPPTIPNPKCETASGCGPWTPPMIRNPKYKGKWYAPLIANPDYKGVWVPRKIENPEYYENRNPSDFDPIAAIGFELWTMQEDILFDNIYLGHSEEDARKFAEETWKVKHELELKAVELEKPAKSRTDKDADKDSDEDEEEEEEELTFSKKPIKFIRSQIDKFITTAQVDLMEAVISFPYVAGGLLAFGVTLLITFFSLLFGGSSSPTPAAAAVAESSSSNKPKSSNKAKKEKKNKKSAAAAGGGGENKESSNEGGDEE